MEQIDKDLGLENLPPEDDSEVDWKAEATKFHGIATRNLTKLQRAQKEFDEYKTQNPSKPEPVKPESARTEEKQGFDHGELAYLIANGVNERHHERLFKLAKEMGTELKDLLSRNWVKNEIKELDEKATTQGATPEGGKPAASKDEGSVEYWLAREEYPENNPELARKVHKARGEQEKKQNKFTKQPIV